MAEQKIQNKREKEHDNPHPEGWWTQQKKLLTTEEQMLDSAGVDYDTYLYDVTEDAELIVADRRKRRMWSF